MNERIRELAIKAGYQKDSFGVGHWDMPECKKFAELIMEEMYVFMCNATDNDKPWPSFKEVKQHFGVEE